jgi:2-C-methyl-D-erythritol 4-phosphate cytidylyltransferase/2-C-methyl-D-erythritol 2,4-cyclodiphosphate synthase
MYRNRKVIALIMAAGNGSRFGAKSPKQFLDVEGESMILRAARTFDECEYVDGIWAVASSDRRADANAALCVLAKYRCAVGGGDTRQESVRLGLRAAAGTPDTESMEGADGAVVLIHDAARPFVTSDIIERVLEGATVTGAAIACVPVTDTIYAANEKPGSGRALLLADAPDRDLLWSVQTPQGFDFDMILRAHEAAALDGFEATDDGAVARIYGYAAGDASDGGKGADVLIVDGDYVNRKITLRGDIDTSLGTPCVERPDFGAPTAERSGLDAYDARGGGRPGDRVGIGFDVHAFAPAWERALVLGGVTLPYERGLEGHSDADVLTHALIDAMLGALALGDIGFYFPETDDRYLGISSMKLLEEVREMIERNGYIVYNADMTIVAERPRMAEHVDDIRDSVAAALGVDRDRIGVKATTTERLGFTGREEGIGAQAIVRLAELAEGE